MPLVIIRGIKGVFNEEEKAEAVRQVTEVMVKLEGEGLRPHTWVLFEDADAWGIGGEIMTPEKIKELQKG